MLDKATIKFHDLEEDEPLYLETELEDIPIPDDFHHNASDVQEALCHLIQAGIYTYDEIYLHQES